MMARSVAEVAEKAERLFVNMDEEFSKETIEEAAVEALKPVVKKAQSNAPRDDGDLRDSITVRRMSEVESNSNKRRGAIGAVMGPTEFYGIFVEIGADQPAQPFIRSAWQSDRRAMRERFQEELEDRLFD